MKNLKKISIIAICIVIILLAVSCIVFVFVPLKKVEATAPNCKQEWNDEYYVNWFGVCFSDKDRTNRVDKAGFYHGPIEHNLEMHPAKTPTCTQNGNIEYWQCSLCGTNFSDKNGKNEITDTKVLATGHTEGKPVVKESTCSEVGWEKVCCTECGEELLSKELPKKEHTRDEGIITKSSTCSEAGIRTFHCTECGEVCGTEKIPLKQHKFKPAENYQNLADYERPTATKNAIIPCYCSECNAFNCLEYKKGIFLAEDDTAIDYKDKYHKDTVEIYDNKGILTFNLSADNWNEKLQSADYCYYDSANRVMTVSPRLNETIRIIGQVKPLNLAIDIETVKSLTLILENLSCSAPSGKVALNLSKVTDATLQISGSVSFVGGIGKDGIIANDLTITGEQGLNVTGGVGVQGKDGAGSYKESGDGGVGGIGISATNLEINMKGTLIVTGGNGGAAYDRSNTKGDANEGEGTNGRSGYTGGTGGKGIFVTSTLTLKIGTINAFGGNGGRGGNGGECNVGAGTMWEHYYFKGGNGGNGGNGGVSLEANTIKLSGGKITATGGDGGDTGKRGGCYNNEHSAAWASATDGDAGNAGIGGEAITITEENIEGDKSLITTKLGNVGNVNNELNQSYR